jgi:LysR family nitrogen assimilation transcriptional regulator
MDRRRLEAFVKVVDLGSISRAAEALHTAQSALSQQVSSLETSLGIALLERSKHGVVPTRAGREFLRHAQTILRQMDQAMQAVTAHADGGPSGRVSIGLAPYSMATSLTVPLLALVRDRYPKIVLHIRENFGAIISEGIATGQMDMGVLYTPVPLRAIDVDPLVTDELVLIVPESGAAALAGGVDFPALTSMPLFLPSRQHSIRQVVDAAFQRVNAFPLLAGELESVPQLLESVRARLGSSILPRRCLPADIGTGVVVVPLGPRPTEMTIALCTAGFQPLTEQAEAVLPLLRGLILANMVQDDVPPHALTN